LAKEQSMIMDKFRIPIAMGAAIAVGWCATMYAGFLVGCIRARRRRWAEQVIEQYEVARREREIRRFFELAGEEYLSGMEIPVDLMEIQSNEGTWDLPPFYVDTLMTKEENAERLREHIDEHAFEMPQDDKDYMVEELVKHAFPMALQMHFQRDLEDLRPEDFRG
jgi:hypothetical protein